MSRGPKCVRCGHHRPPSAYKTRPSRGGSTCGVCRMCQESQGRKGWPRVPEGMTPDRARSRATAARRRIREAGLLVPPGECQCCRSVYAPLRAMHPSVEPSDLVSVIWLCTDCVALGPDVVCDHLLDTSTTRGR